MMSVKVSEEQFSKVLELVESGKQAGASVTCGGQKWGSEGYFVEPTVFADVTDDMRIAQEEVNHPINLLLLNLKCNLQSFLPKMRIQIFGPVQTILKFSNMEEVIERANNTNYGLAAGVLTKDINTALTFSQAVEAGSVW